MNKQSFRELAEKITAGVATDTEIALFNEWYESFQGNEKVWSVEEMGDSQEVEAELLRSINQRIGGDAHRSSWVEMNRVAAAVIVLLTALGGYFWYSSGQTISESEVMSDLEIRNDVEPGKEKAILTLGDGTEIMLDEVKQGLLAYEGNASVKKSEKGLIVYRPDTQLSQPSAQEDKPLVYNAISTPRGGKYKVMLPDETEVWLNAMSSIRFPTQFAEDVREVEITGEVYFDVASDASKPFLVRSADQIVKVLGTQFNIKAYSDEESIQTTLVEGAVLVEVADEHVRIKPGEQVVNPVSSPLQVVPADVEQVIAWKNGLFQFWDTHLEDVMRQLARWYDVEVTYLGEQNEIAFTGFISRDVTISNVLQMLEEASSVKFGVEGKQVIVKTEM